jgi:hypothetical protein
VKVYLDDVREAPPGWVRTYTPEEVIALLQSGEVEELSLDHDLGLDTPAAERSGYSVLVWLEREVGEGRWSFPLPDITVHSANPPGRERMRRAIESILRLSSAQT